MLNIPIDTICQWDTPLSSYDILVVSKIELSDELRISGRAFRDGGEGQDFILCANKNLFALRVLRENCADDNLIRLYNAMGPTLKYSSLTHLSVADQAVAFALLQTSVCSITHHLLVTTEYLIDIIGPGVPSLILS